MGQAVVLEQDPAAGTPVNRSLLSFGLETEAPIENVMGWLLQVVLARGPTFGMPLDEAAREIETHTGLRFDRMELRRCIELSPALEIELTTHDNPICLISASVREAVLGRLAVAERNELAILNSWANEILAEPASPKISQDDFLNDFRLFYSNVALIHGMESVALVYEDRPDREKFLKQLSTGVWKKTPDRTANYREFCKVAFPKFFLEATGQQAALIANLLDRTFELCRLNLGDKTSKILLDQLSGLTAYLDTNIVFRLLGLHGPAPHLDVRRMIIMGQKANVVFRVTPRTVKEFDTAVRSAIRNKKMRFVAPDALIGLDPMQDDKEFLKEYFRLQTRTTWSENDLLASVNHVNRTLARLGVKIWTEKVEAVEKNYDTVASLAQELKEYYEKREMLKSPEQRKHVQDEKAEHDAYHIELIKALRPKRTNTFTETKFWFLTSHRFLAKMAYRMANGRPATVILIEQWHQLLRSVLPRSDRFDETFARNLHSPLFQAHRGNYSKAHEAILCRLSTYSKLDPEHFANIVADAHFMGRVAAVEASSDAPDEKAFALVDQRLALELNKEKQQRVELSTKYRDERRRADMASAAVAEMGQELANTQSKVDTLTTQVNDLVGKLDYEKTRRIDFLWYGAAVVACLMTLAIWLWGREGQAVARLHISIWPVTVALLGLGLCAAFRKAWAFILSIVSIVVSCAAAGVTPTPVVNTIEQPREPAGDVTGHDALRTPKRVGKPHSSSKK